MHNLLVLIRLLPVVIAVVLVCGLGKALAAEQHPISAPGKQESIPACQEAQPGGPEEIVRGLYMQYPFDGKPVFIEPKEILIKYFHANLVDLLIEDQECWKNTGSICAFNVNAMYDAQGGEISDLKVCAMNIVNAGVQVQFMNSGEPQVVNYRINKTNDGWRISDISIPKKQGDWSFAGMLSLHYGKLSAAWKKAQGPEQVTVDAKNKEPLPHCDLAKKGGAEDLVRSLYEKYPWKGDRIILNEPKNVLDQYFSKDFAEIIYKDQQVRVGHDYPFRGMPNVIINRDMGFSQDVSGFRICAMDSGAKTVSVQFRDSGEPRIVVIKLLNTTAGWRISDLFYIDGVRSFEPGQEYDWSMRQALTAE